MIRFIKDFFNNWTRPLVFFGITVVFTNLALLSKNRNAETIAAILLLLALVCILVSIVYQLIKKNWQEATVTALIFGLTVFFLFLLAPTLSGKFRSQPAALQGEPAVPAEIAVSMPPPPLTDSLAQPKKQSMDFDIYHGAMPGNYTYNCWLTKTDSGVVYLKVFEQANNQPVSPTSLPGSTSLPVYNPLDSLIKFSAPASFTIIEGNRGKPCAARFELWFKPDAGGAESMLLSKQYTIEGGGMAH